jgi:hypothetical protein
MAVHGKNTYIEIDNAAGALQPIQAYTRSAANSEKTDTAESSNFGQQSKTYVAGMDDGSLSIGGTFAPAFLTLLREARAAINAGTIDSVTCKVGYSGNTIGMEFESAEYLITTISVSASTSDVVTLSLELQRTGDPTYGTYA